VARVRSFSSLLVSVLLLCNVLQAAQIGWTFDTMWGLTGNSGVAQPGDVSDARAVTDFEDNSPQETPDDCVASGLSVSNGTRSRSHALMNETPPSTLLVSRLVHPPAARS
jgi:hypothetical protein